MSLPAFAQNIAVVDFQRAVTETNEGKAAQTKIDTMYTTRRGEIERRTKDLERDIQDYQARRPILSEQARAEEEQKLGIRQQQLAQDTMQYEQELQQTYGQLLETLGTKMRTLSTTIAKQKGYDLVVDMAAVVYVGDGVSDITDTLVTQYNAGNQ
jgi:outer membrane protein